MKKRYYSVCPFCGANLDPGERCDCQQAQAVQMKTKKKAQGGK